MDIKQVASFVNDALKETLGETTLIQEDLSNVVEVGTAVFNADATDKYVRSLINHIGKVVFVSRLYQGKTPSVLKDGWEYGSIKEKIRTELPDSEENESWELIDGASYDNQVFKAPKVHVKFFNKLTTFEVPISITERQVKQSFSNAIQLNAFVSMILVAVENRLTLDMENLIRRTINNMIAETLYDEYAGSGYSLSSKVKAVNLLYLYNQKFGASLTKAEAIVTPSFIRFATLTIDLICNRMGVFSKLYNIGETEKFTPKDKLHVILLDEFASASKILLQSETYNKEEVQLPKHETVPYWQGSGTDFEFTSTSKIYVKTASDNTHAVTLDGIIGVAFDDEALGVSNEDRRVTTAYNAKGEFYNYFYKCDAEYFNDLDENCVVFFIQ